MPIVEKKKKKKKKTVTTTATTKRAVLRSIAFKSAAVHITSLLAWSHLVFLLSN